MSNWKKGDVAICINIGRLNSGSDGILPPLRLNVEYLVQLVKVCECGRIDLDVGLSLTSNLEGVECKCGAKSSPKTGIHWCASQRFTKRKIDSIQEQIEEAIKNENYELASELKKKL